MTFNRRLMIAGSGAGLALVALAVSSSRAEAPAAVMHSGVFTWESLPPQATKIGAVRRVFDTPTPTLERLEMHITTLRPGESPHGPHRHPQEELIIIKEGTVESHIEGVLRRAGPGSILFHASKRGPHAQERGHDRRDLPRHQLEVRGHAAKVIEPSPAVIEALRRDESAPVGVVRPTARPGTEDDGGEVLACAGCLRPVTTAAARTAVAGAHEHTFANPAGFQFHIGCFARVIGCAAAGEPSTYWTWFPGYAWQVEHCATCGEHLGWLFRMEGHAFHGLVLDRLVVVED